MALTIGDNFSYMGAKPLDARLKYNTITEMKSVASSSLYDGCLAYVTNEHKYYSYDSFNDVDVTLGKWRELKTDSSGTNNVVEGYYNVGDGKFYKEQAFVTEIEGTINTLYLSLDSNALYYFDGTNYVNIYYPTPVFKPAGSVAFANLPTLNSALIGNVYNITNSFTTTADFIEGADHNYPANTNVVIVDIGVGTPNLKFDVFTGVFDFTAYEIATADVDGLPNVATPSTKVLYFVATANRYNTFIYNGSTFVKINPDPVDYIINGYYNSTDHLFYEEDTYTTAIIGAINRIYISLDTNKTYRFNGTIFVRLDEETFESIQVTVIPTATVDDLGKIVQFVGTSTAEYTNGYFYECVEDEENPGDYIWVAKEVQEGGSGSGSLQRAITAAIEVGGIDAGDEFAVGTSYDDMWDALLNPTLYPTFTAPSASLSYSADTYYEVGATISAKNGTVTYNAGAITINGVKQNDRGGSVNNYTLVSTGADTDYSDSSTSSGTFNVPALTKSTKGTITLTATVNYAEGPQPKDSKGNDYSTPLPAGSVTATKIMNFILPYYYGKSSTSTVSDFSNLTKSITAKGQKQFKFTTNNEYMVIAYDSSYGNLSSIIDPNGFETISGWTKSTLTVGGFSYNVYVANSATTDTNAQFTFKY